MIHNPPDISVSDTKDDYPSFLDLVIPVGILAISVAYAWSLLGMSNASMNLLLIAPLLVTIWGLLLIIALKDLWPASRMRAREAGPVLSTERLLSRSEARAGLVVLATFCFAFVAVGHGPWIFATSSFFYLMATGYLTGERRLHSLIFQATASVAGLYLIMGIVLGVRF